MPFDINKHKEAYLNEAKTYVNTMNKVLVDLERNQEDKNLFHHFFRSVHTLKSISATMGYEQNVGICHAMEDVLDAVRHEEIALQKCTDILFECIDLISLNIKSLAVNTEELDATKVINKLSQLLNTEKAASTADYRPPLTQPEIEAVEKIQSIEVKIEKLDVLVNLIEEFLVNKLKLEAIREQIEHHELPPLIEAMNRLITDFQYHVMQLRLIPVAYVFNRFFRMTRDLAKQQKKQVNLVIEGTEIELDRSLIDEISESITHIIRNAIDHGIETPDIRLKQNKPEEGTIWLRVFRTNEAVKIEIADDGAGLNFDAIRKVAAAKNLINLRSENTVIMNTIFNGVSTAQSVTEISGRGLGLSIVKSKIESIGGTINVQSEAGVGTTFLIEIPLSLAIIKTLFIRIGSETYAIPTEYVERLLLIESNEIKGLMNDEAIIYENIDLPLIRLNNLFNQDHVQLEKQPLVIISKGNERIALAVDQLLETQEVIIKKLNRSIAEIKYFSGATLIGSGQMVLILDIAYLLSLRKSNESSRGGIINAI